MSDIDRLPYVEAELNYLGPIAERPRYYAYEPGPNDPPSVMPHEPHRMQIHSLRPVSDPTKPCRYGLPPSPLSSSSVMSGSTVSEMESCSRAAA